MGGGGGKSSEKKTSIDPRLEAAGLDALDYAATVARIPFQPNRGVQIADFNGTQKDSFKNTNSMAEAFGMASTGGMNLPKTEMAANGMRGYSTGKVYDQAMNKSVSKPMQNSIAQLFANPKTGQMFDQTSPLFQQIYGDRSGKGGGAGAGASAAATAKPQTYEEKLFAQQRANRGR